MHNARPCLPRSQISTEWKSAHCILVLEQHAHRHTCLPCHRLAQNGSQLMAYWCQINLDTVAHACPVTDWHRMEVSSWHIGARSTWTQSHMPALSQIGTEWKTAHCILVLEQHAHRHTCLPCHRLAQNGSQLMAYWCQINLDTVTHACPVTDWHRMEVSSQHISARTTCTPSHMPALSQIGTEWKSAHSI